MPSPENFGICTIQPDKSGTRVAIVLRPDQLGKLSNLLDTASLPKGGNKTEFDNNLGLFKKAFNYAQRSFTPKAEGV